MVHVDLDNNEAVMMKEILENYLWELTSEIHNTDTREFRESLKKQKELVVNVIGRISDVAA